MAKISNPTFEIRRSFDMLGGTVELYAAEGPARGGRAKGTQSYVNIVYKTVTPACPHSIEGQNGVTYDEQVEICDDFRWTGLGMVDAAQLATFTEEAAREAYLTEQARRFVEQSIGTHLLETRDELNEANEYMRSYR